MPGAARLAAAILDDALLLVRHRHQAIHRHDQDVRRRTERAEAAAWFLASGPSEHPFAFVNICKSLALDAAHVRAAVCAAYDLETIGRRPAALARGRPRRAASNGKG